MGDNSAILDLISTNLFLNGTPRAPLIGDVTYDSESRCLKFFGTDGEWIKMSPPIDIDKANPYKEPNHCLRKGNKGESVKWLQWELTYKGFLTIVDGIFGDSTFSSLIKFQKSANITVDGICGESTINALKYGSIKNDYKNKSSNNPKIPIALKCQCCGAPIRYGDEKCAFCKTSFTWV